MTDRGVSPLEADLAAAAAGAALDTMAREWLRTDGPADRLALADRIFTMLRPAFLS
ncbi:hypothetical protein ITP53_06715 [Nonomuraea sp. K274]|uniref:TetR family transcriptional regulator n=1 Tax=Nonomuraea cypriaca TaxID=1187855 RepID=A0A931EVA6_9ACTN|nr:hypothetical protein [Nonomuraea cypriaca]MBF8185434.1 hypothetical protein [Nonomuraea cypriaca]